MKPTEDQIIIEAIMGSHAYGLARPDSDLDFHGCWVWPNERFLGIDLPSKKDLTYHSVGEEKDFTYHELQKWASLAASCNPTILELLWRGEYTRITPAGQLLVDNRSEFLSRSAVVAKYGGYATAQAKNFLAHGDDTPRYKKEAGHTFRLLEQAKQLLSTGTMDLRVKDPEKFSRMGATSPQELYAEFARGRAQLEEISSPLPERANLDVLNELVLNVRKTFALG